MAEDHLLTRNLTVLFGFFFVIFSTLIAAATSLSSSDTTAAQNTSLVLFFSGVQLSIGCTLIGIELWMRFSKDGLRSAGKLGFSWLVLITPFIYDVLLAFIMNIDSLWLVFGLLMYVVGVQCPYLYSFFKSDVTRSD